MNDVPLKVWLEKDGALLRLRLARPKANLIDAEMISALFVALDTHRDNPGLLAALIDHEGPHFSFGASVEEHLPERCEAMLRQLHSLLHEMLGLSTAITVLCYVALLLTIRHALWTTIKATYMLPVFPFMALLAGDLLAAGAERSRRLVAGAVAGLVAVALHNAPALLHAVWDAPGARHEPCPLALYK